MTRYPAQWQIVFLALLTEGLLAALYLAWTFFRADALPPSLSITPTAAEFAFGVLAAVALFALNIGVLSGSVRRVIPLAQCVEFVDRIVKPLADQLSYSAALLISISAGIGEELFFRGVLQFEFGLLVASACFSLLHFGTAVVKYPVVAVIYFLMGIMLGLIYQQTQSLWTAITAHAVYDFIALVYLKVTYQRGNTLDQKAPSADSPQ